MANRINRYRAAYDLIKRPDNVANFPRHVFSRGANLHSNIYDRVGDRTSCFDTTLVHLTERFTGKDVYLVGTMNQSTMLAQRTQKLIQELKPTNVMVQANEDWWTSARTLQYVDSQEEFNGYSADLQKYDTRKWLHFYWATRKFLFLGRLAMYYKLFNWHFKFGPDFAFFTPGLEIKQACQAAQEVGAKLTFLGSEMDQVTWQRLAHEARMNVPHYAYKRYQYADSFWSDELNTNRHKLSMVGPQAFSEKCLDSHLMNWYIQSADIFFPKFKEIFIDKRDEDLFRQIAECKGDRVVVVVNQMHMEGIEHNWASRFGQVPRSVEFPEGINPIGDMNLREGLFQRLYNDLHRHIAGGHSGQKPSTYADWIIGYHRESNWQYEHRDM